MRYIDQFFPVKDGQALSPPNALRYLDWIMPVGCSVFFLSLIAYNFIDIDTWHEMALIRESISAGHLLTVDPYAYTPTLHPLVDHEWGAGVIAFFSTLWLGGRALVVLKFLIAFTTVFVCWTCARRTGADVRLIYIVTPFALFLAQFGFLTVLRAQVYSFMFTALLFLLLQLDRMGRQRWTVYFLLAFPIWVNVHGGFVAAFGLLTLHLIEQLLRRRPCRHILLVLAIMSLETLLNPYGAAYWAFLHRALTISRPYVAEWRPVWDLGPYWAASVFAAIAIPAYALGAQGISQVQGLLPFTATAIEAVLHRKLLPIFVVAWLCLVPGWVSTTVLGGWLVRFSQRKRMFHLTAWIVISIASMVGAVRARFWEPAVPQSFYPLGAVNYLANVKFQGNLMTPFRLGAYVSWKLFPAVKISFDSRYEVAYPEQVTKDIFDFYDASSTWNDVLRKYPTDLVLVPEESAIAALIRESDWKRIYRDQQFAVYARPGYAISVMDCTYCRFTGQFP
jgi:hypothetical protein